MSNYITVDGDATIHLDEYLYKYSDFDLVEELESRNIFIQGEKPEQTQEKKKLIISVSAEADIDITDYLDEFDNDELIDELERRGIYIEPEEDEPELVTIYKLNPIEFKRHLCDLLEIGYYQNSNEEILKMLKDVLKQGL